MKGIHRTPRDPRMWDKFFLDDDEFEAEKQRASVGSDEIVFLPNYEYDEDGRLHIEDYSEMKDYHIVQEIEKWMDHAARVALKSICQKSQRGTVVVRGDELLGEAYNGPPLDERCDPCLRMDIKNNTRFDLCYGVHAEERAVRSALSKAGNLEGSRLYYVKTKDGEIRPSGTIACTQCSRIILDSGIAEVVMWRRDAHLKNEQVAYEPNAFDDVTGDPDSVFLRTGIQTAHFVIYSARKFNGLALQYVKERVK